MASASRRTRTRLDPEVRREQIVAAAEEVFAGRDPNDVTFEQVAEAAGVSRALVYNYFGDKGGLVAAVYQRSSQRLDDALDRVTTPADDPADRVRAVVDRYLQFATENAAAWRLLGSAEAAVHPVVQRLRRDRYRQMASEWGGTAEAWMLARGVLGFLEAATLEWLERGARDRARATEAISSLLWSGLAGAGRLGLALDVDRDASPAG